MGLDFLEQLFVDSRDGLLRVEEQQHHVGPANAAFGPHQPVELDVAGHALVLAHAGRVDGDERFAVHLKADVDAVAGRARNFADDHPLRLG